LFPNLIESYKYLNLFTFLLQNETTLFETL